MIANGLNNGTKVAIYDTAGHLIGTATASNGTVAIDTKMAGGNAIIVKIGANSAKFSVK